MKLDSNPLLSVSADVKKAAPSSGSDAPGGGKKAKQTLFSSLSPEGLETPEHKESVLLRAVEV